MGKFRSKIKGQTKGKRWPKGQSSISNPETRKYRDQAKTGFFQGNGGPSNLTTESLMKHDAIQTYKTVPSNDVEMSESSYHPRSESSYSGTASSYKTFASDWSECTNQSFDRFLNTFQANSALHKEMLAILAAITDVIKQNGGNETSTEYYCSLLTTLDTVYNSEEKKEEQITAVLALLNMGIRKVPEAVLRKHFSEISLKICHILKDFATSENNVILKSTIGIMTTVLRAQELAMWNHDTTKQIFCAILNAFCIHTKPKWRKAAQNAVAVIVRSPCFNEAPNQNLAADKAAEFCEEILQNCMGGGGSGAVPFTSIQASQTTILHTLTLLKGIIPTFTKHHMKKSCEVILRLMTLNDPIVTSCGYQVFDALFTDQKSVISSDLNVKLIAALYEYQPSKTDIQPTLAWTLVMQEAHVHLADTDIVAAINLLPKIISNVSQMWLCGEPNVLTAATHCLEVIFKDAIAPACESQETVERHRPKLEKCFDLIHSCLSYQYNTIWQQVLYIVGVMFQVAGGSCSDMLVGVLNSLAELRDSYKFSFNNELEYAVGAAIRSMGPEKVLEVIPLSKANGELNIDRSWLLPVLKENIKCSTLRYFREHIFPMARFCQQRATELAQTNNGIGAHSSELLYLQLWNLLSCFCNHPTDVQSEFKNLAKLLGMAISERKELRLAVMASLRRLINNAKETDNQNDLKELARFDKNYLPILFNVYTTKPIGSDEEGQRLAALETLKLYLTISRPELNKELFENALQRLNASSDEPEDHFIKESILDLIRTLIPYQTVESISAIYGQCVQNLPKIKNKKEQKKAYRILEVIVSSEAEGCKTFVRNHRKEVQKLLMKSLETAATSSKSARLRCLNYLISAQPHLDHESKLIKACIPEAVLCCKDINEKCRKIAFELLNTIGHTLLAHDQLQEFVVLVMAGLANDTQMISCTILALASILHNFTGALGIENIKMILESVATLGASQTREIVGSCLSFIKVYCTTLPHLMVQASLANIMKMLTGMTEDCKRHYRLKVRDILDRLIRKYGVDSVTPYVPSDDQVMYKRIKNLRKLNDRKKKLKEQKRGSKANDDSDENNEDFIVKSQPKSVEDILADSDSDLDMEIDDKPATNKSKKRAKNNTWIEEDPESIVDFTDPAAVRNITATKPQNAQSQVSVSQQEQLKNKNRGFKSAPDGRLIIKDDGSSDSDDGKKLKINLNSDSSDTDNEDDSVAETLLLANRKRKRQGSVKSGFSAASSVPQPKYKSGGIGIHRPVTSASSVKSGMSGTRWPIPKVKKGVIK